MYICICAVYHWKARNKQRLILAGIHLWRKTTETGKDFSSYLTCGISFPVSILPWLFSIFMMKHGLETRLARLGFFPAKSLVLCDPHVEAESWSVDHIKALKLLTQGNYLCSVTSTKMWQLVECKSGITVHTQHKLGEVVTITKTRVHIKIANHSFSCSYVIAQGHITLE